MVRGRRAAPLRSCLWQNQKWHSETFPHLHVEGVAAFNVRAVVSVWECFHFSLSLLWRKSISAFLISFSFDPDINKSWFFIFFEHLRPCGSSGPCLSGGRCLQNFTAPCSSCSLGLGRRSAGPPGPLMSSMLPFASGWRLPPLSSPSVTSVADTSTRPLPSPTWLALRCLCSGLSSTSWPSVLERWQVLLCSMGSRPATWGETSPSTRWVCQTLLPSRQAWRWAVNNCVCSGL